MTTPIQEIYRQYLRREASLDDLRNWLALNQWDLPEEDQDLADEAEVAIIHYDDKYGDEDYVRFRLAMMLERCTTTTVSFATQVKHSPSGFLSLPQITKDTARTKAGVLAIAAV